MFYSKEIVQKKNYDLIVAGGGFAGFSAAYAAAREGMHVLLIERSSALGGVGTMGLVTDILGAKYIDREGNVTLTSGDVFETIERRLFERCAAVDIKNVDFNVTPHGWLRGLAHGLIYDKEDMKLLLEEMLSEVGAELLYSTDVVDVIKEGSCIRSVVVHNKSGLYALGADRFVDATGDADLVRYSGGRVFKGDSEGGLSAASLDMQVENVDDDALFEYMERTGDRRFKTIISELTERGIWTFSYKIFISLKLIKKGTYMINTIRQVGVDGSDAESITRAVIDGRRESYELLRIMRNHFPGFQNATVREIAPTIGIRETYRIDSEYILTVDDLARGREFDDSIALSSYGWDMPHPKDPNYHPSSGIRRRSPYTEIPYRCLLPKGIDNLITVGRCVGAEREALGPIRVMGAVIAMGTAAGIASSLAKDEGCSFRDVNVSTLRERITEHGGITEESKTRFLFKGKEEN